MKGIILSGGSGSRLFPATRSTSKQLLCVYDKPMVYYSLSVLMLSGLKEILLISTPEDIDRYENLLSDGKEFGLKISYKIQKNPNGLAQAFILGENFIGNDDVCLILGDNILYGQGLTQTLIEAKQIVNNKKKAVIFGYNVPNPKDFGVVEFDDKGNTISIEEKPKKPKSDFAIIGLYFYPNCVIKKSKSIDCNLFPLLS